MPQHRKRNSRKSRYERKSRKSRYELRKSRKSSFSRYKFRSSTFLDSATLREIDRKREETISSDPSVAALHSLPEEVQNIVRQQYFNRSKIIPLRPGWGYHARDPVNLIIHVSYSGNIQFSVDPFETRWISFLLDHRRRAEVEGELDFHNFFGEDVFGTIIREWGWNTDVYFRPTTTYGRAEDDANGVAIQGFAGTCTFYVRKPDLRNNLFTIIANRFLQQIGTQYKLKVESNETQVGGREVIFSIWKVVPVPVSNPKDQLKQTIPSTVTFFDPTTTTFTIEAPLRARDGTNA